MITKTPTAYKVFQYLRGAIRGAYGVEEFRGKAILIKGMDTVGQELLVRLCLPDVNIYFLDSSVSNYYEAHRICEYVIPYPFDLGMDIIIDFNERILAVNGVEYSLDLIEDNPYEQGIHQFYCQSKEHGHEPQHPRGT